MVITCCILFIFDVCMFEIEILISINIFCIINAHNLNLIFFVQILIAGQTLLIVVYTFEFKCVVSFHQIKKLSFE